MHLSRQRVVGLVLIGLLAVMALYGVFGLGVALHNIGRQNRTAECVRRVNADTDQQFQNDFFDVLDAAFARDPGRALAIAKERRQRPTRAQQLAKECPSAIRPTTTKGTP